jgi:hypothetical protein
MAYMLISELRRALKETADQATANTRNAAELKVQLRKEIPSSRGARAGMGYVYRKTHKEEEEAREQEQRRRAAVAAQPSERRNRGLEDASDRVDLRLLASNLPSDSAADTSHLATPRGTDNVLSSALVLGSVSTLGKFLQVSIGLVSTRNPGHGRLRCGASSRVGT